MNPYGDGSNGALNVTGTTSLPLNTKLQYTTVNVAAGGTLTTNSTTGAVLYIVATESITIDGTINVSNRVNRGNNSWSVTLDGVTYSSPGVALGAKWTGQSDNTSGYGSGGPGIGFVGGAQGGQGGSGGASPSGGPYRSGERTTNGTTDTPGYNGTNSGGGSGAVALVISGMSGYVSGSARAQSGAGASTHGGNGGDAPFAVVDVIASSGGGSAGAGGGGGGGGYAGRAGVKVVLKAPSVTINGQIITSGTNGGNGGNGGRSRDHNGYTNVWGNPGLGGGGGRGGRVEVYYGSSLSFTGDFDDHVSQAGGSGGVSGYGGQNNQQASAVGGSGGHEGWGYYRLTPVANFSATPLSGQRPLEVAFTNTSQGATSYTWNFGDSSGSSETNPVHEYANPGTYTVSLTATNNAGSDVRTRTDYITVTIASYTRSGGGTIVFGGGADRKHLASRSGGGTLILGGSARAIVIRDAETLQDKTYLYKVYDPDGSYIETWKDVTSELNFTHEINTIGSTTYVTLARNSDTLGTSTSPLQTEADADLLTEDDLQILVATASRNQIGSGSSVDYNNRVDVVAFYGSVEALFTESLEVIQTEDDEDLLADIGAPNGRRIFTGFISEINSRYGNTEDTVVQLTSYGWDLDQYPITTAYDNDVTTVTFNSYDPADIVTESIDRFVARSNLEQVSYTHRTTNSVQDTGTVVSYTFRANTYKEVLDKSLELMPSNWYYRVGLGDNVVYFDERATDPRHLFILGKHIRALDLKGSILNVVNNTLFTGGGDPALYVQRKESPASRTRRGLDVTSDARVTVDESAEIISDGKIESLNKLLYRTTIEVLSKQYDIESINVGEVVGFRNFGNYVDGLTMQIVGLNYTPDYVQLQLETKPPTINKRLEDIRRNMTVSENQNIPSSPS